MELDPAALADLRAHRAAFAHGADESAIMAFVLSGGDLEGLLRLVEAYCGGPPAAGEMPKVIAALLDL